MLNSVQAIRKVYHCISDQRMIIDYRESDPVLPVDDWQDVGLYFYWLGLIENNQTIKSKTPHSTRASV